MTETRARILHSAEAAFDAEGFAATGVDRLTERAGVSTRTLYKHVGGKPALVEVVLAARADRFAQAVRDVDGTAALFAALGAWVETEGARGCLFLRAAGEAGALPAGASAVIAGYRATLADAVAAAVAADLGRADARLAEQVLVLFEGATSAASYRGRVAVDAAASAATTLVGAAR